MAMVIKNNVAAQMALGELNKNNNKLAKALEKAASGQKLNSAADDASGYAISERMRVQLRGLESTHANTQNATSLLKTAEGAVSSTVDILKSFKEKAIDAANDTNTDDDRAIIQKELNQYMSQIEDNASVTFNGKRLLDGTQGRGIVANPWDAMASFMSYLDDANTTAADALDGAIKYVSGGKFENEKALIDSFINDITNSGLDACGIDLDNDDTGAITGKDARNEVVKTAESIVPEKDYPYGGDPTGGTSRIRGLTINWPDSVSSDVERAILGALDNPWLQNCMDLIDESYALNFWENGNYVRTMDVKLAYEGTSGTLAYVTSSSAGGETVGLSMTINMSYYSSIDLNDWNGEASGGAGYLDRTIAHEMVHALMSANIKNFSSLPKYIKEGAAEVVHGIDDFRKSTIQTLVASPSTLRSVLEDSSSASGDQAYAAGYMILRYLAKQSADAEPEKNLVFHTGTKANQQMRVGLADMRCKALGLRKSDGTTLSVVTQELANSAITVIDRAIGRALKQQTLIGAMTSRLEYTASNIMTAHENVTSSESVIRDADMAKAMTDYTKANVLSQSAQSMLAQANQNSSSVLSLLQ
ncbi:flagellin [Selenomonas sp.]|uniref:flagellin N-terminal helical domain-containing protein n=1 Tax=Selenomonas sp. TaxID=2053611 RepID=UPI0025FC1230|nr:flagellin [Selenomonas sp.]